MFEKKLHVLAIIPTPRKG